MQKILGLFLLLASSTLLANTVVEVNWPFSISSSTTNYVRAVIEQANNNQQDYQFVLVQRTGAGGSIAANHVKNSKTLSLLATSNAFFVRPYLFPDQSYKFEDFKPLLIMGSMPMGFVSKANSDWNSITKKKQISIGVPGVGSFSYVLAYRLAQKYPQTVIVPYQGTTEALKDVAGGVLELSVDVPAMALSAPDLYRMNYITGNNTFGGQFQLARQHIDPVFGELSLEFAILAPSNLNAQQTKQLTGILQQAHNSNARLSIMYKQDFVTTITADADTWYQTNIRKWNTLTQNIKIQ
jgi:hypothetical protein